jgi:uncharacterized protein (DUF427 family)
METKTSKGKEIRVPGPDHPITISPAEGRVCVTVAGRIVAKSTRALRLEEKGYPPVYYLPRHDADMSLLVRTKHYTYCPYKGDCTYHMSYHLGQVTLALRSPRQIYVRPGQRFASIAPRKRRPLEVLPASPTFAFPATAELWAMT